MTHNPYSQQFRPPRELHPRPAQPGAPAPGDGSDNIGQQPVNTLPAGGGWSADSASFPPPMPPDQDWPVPPSPAGRHTNTAVPQPIPQYSSNAEPGYRPTTGPVPRTSQGIDESAWSTEASEKTGPSQGWRGGLAKVGIKLAKSAKEAEYDRDVLRIQRKIAYPRNIVVVGLKGGVGKSTITVALGSTLSVHRNVSDVVAIDADTDGSLRRRMPKERNKAVASDVRQFLRSINERTERPLSGSEVQVQLYSNSAGLQTLVSAENVAEYRLSEDEYNGIISVLQGEYMINLVDTSPDRQAPAFTPALESAHAVVLVTVPNALSVDSAARFIAIMQKDFKHLLTRTVLIWNDAAPGRNVAIDVDRTKAEFVRQLSAENDASTCLVEVPLDQHLAAGGEINLSLLQKNTRRQFERAAALVMDKLPDDRITHR